jgi:hypothetical protein
MRRVIEPGTFTVFIGGNSAATLEAHFRVTDDLVVLLPPPPLLR